MAIKLKAVSNLVGNLLNGSCGEAGGRPNRVGICNHKVKTADQSGYN